MESQESTIQNFIGYIKNISLHFQNLLAPSQQDLKSITNKTFKMISDFEKFVQEYNKKLVSEIQNSKVTVPLIFYRTIKDKINEDQFLKFQYKGYELKYVFVRINLECHLHVQIYRNICDFRKSSIAFEKLQNTFIYMLYKKITEGEETISLNFLQDNAKNFLQQIYKILNGQILCSKCRKTMNYHNQLRILLPPTIRIQTIRDLRFNQNQYLPPSKYLHESCL